jgi:hypothetical protein
MSAARLAPVVDAEFAILGDQRRRDRRASDRRAQRLRLEPLFAATLVNHIARHEAPRPRAYAPAGARPGIVVNLEA